MSPAVIGIVAFWIIIILALWTGIGVIRIRSLRRDMERVLDLASVKGDLAMVQNIQSLKAKLTALNAFTIGRNRLELYVQLRSLEQRLRGQAR